MTNTAAVAEHFSLTTGLPADLTPVAFSAPTSVNSGTPYPQVQVSWRVTNQGTAPATGGWYDTVWFATNGVLDASSIDLGNFLITSTVPAGGSYAETNLVTLPLSASGTYTMFVQVDEYDSIYEANLGDKVSAGVTGTFTLAPPPLGIAGISLAGANLSITGSNGLAGATCYVLMSTNLASLWLPLTTNVLNAGGNFTITATNAVNPQAPQRYFILEMK